MKLDIFMQKTSNLWAENRLLKFVVVALSIGLAVNVSMVTKAMNSQRTIILPPVVNSMIEISGDQASDAYIKEFTRYVSSLAFSYSPGTARQQFSELLNLYHPSVFQQAKTNLYSLADKIESLHASSYFLITKNPVHDRAKKQIIIEGNIRSYQNDQVTENGQKTFVISYLMDNGHFYVLGVQEQDKNAQRQEAAAVKKQQ
jgi:conjugal transfer pilus assembly protein TraE